MKRSFLTLLILSMVAAGSLDAEKYFFQYERELQTSGIATLELTNQIGQVTIRTHDSSTVLVKATKKISVAKEKEANEILDNIDVKVERSGDQITVTTNIGEISDSKKSLWRRLLGGTDENPLLAVDYDIVVPRHCELKIENLSGSVTIDSITGNVSVQSSSAAISMTDITGAVNVTGSGKISVQQVNGPTTIKSTGSKVTLASIEGPVEIDNAGGQTDGQLLFGSVTVKQESGKINLQFVEGDIRIKSSSAGITIKQETGSLDIVTYTGSIDIQTALQSDKDYFVATASGDIRLRIPQESSGRLQITSQAGDIKTEVPVVVDAMSKRELVGSFGSGGVKITLSSTTGDVTVAEF